MCQEIRGYSGRQASVTWVLPCCSATADRCTNGYANVLLARRSDVFRRSGKHPRRLSASVPTGRGRCDEKSRENALYVPMRPFGQFGDVPIPGLMVVGLRTFTRGRVAKWGALTARATHRDIRRTNIPATRQLWRGDREPDSTRRVRC